MNTNRNPPPGLDYCPHCDCGFDGIDEDGRPYSCYACGETGWMPAEAVAQYRRDCAWADYIAAETRIRERARLGVPPGWSYYLDDYDGSVVMVPPPGERLPVMVEFEDIPF